MVHVTVKVDRDNNSCYRLKVNFIYNSLGTMEDCAERKRLEELMTSSNLPPASMVQALCASNKASPSAVHASPNVTPQPTPPGTPNSIRKLPRLIVAHGRFIYKTKSDFDITTTFVDILLHLLLYDIAGRYEGKEEAISFTFQQ